jgi:hypothetical protein
LAFSGESKRGDRRFVDAARSAVHVTQLGDNFNRADQVDQLLWGRTANGQPGAFAGAVVRECIEDEYACGCEWAAHQIDGARPVVVADEEMEHCAVMPHRPLVWWFPNEQVLLDPFDAPGAQSWGVTPS